jgi:hypothetical protein
MRPDDCLDQDCDEVRRRDRYRKERNEARTALAAARTALADARSAYEQLLRRYASIAYPGRAEVADNWVRNCRELAAMDQALAEGE